MGWAPRFLQRLPLFASLRGYRAGWLRDDIAAGLAIAAVGLPTAIAYPAIAGLPPEVGLYASIAPMMAYAFFGPSRQLIIGPDAATMTVLAGILSAVLASSPALQTEDKVAVAAVISIGVGVMCLLGKALGLGMLASLLSRPILIGFFAGISIDILIGQIGRLTGMKINTSGLIQPLFELAGRLDAIHAISLVLAIAMFVVLELARIMRSPVPGPVIVIALSLLLSWAFDLQSRGVAVVGTIPTDLPPLRLPSFSNLPFGEIVLGCAAVFIITFGAGIITARSFAAKTGANVDPNAELAGFGAANIASGLVGSFPVTASDSRTAVNHSVGGRSQIASLSAALALLGALVFFSNALRIIPIPALGAILVSAAVHLIDLASLRDVWRVSRVEFAFALVAMFGAISFGVLQGVAISIAGTLAYLLFKGMQPRVVLLGRIPGREGFYKLHRSDQAAQVRGFALCLIQGSVLFFNVDQIKMRLWDILDELETGTRWFVLDAGAVSMVDSSGAELLEEFRSELVRRNILLAIAELNYEPRKLLERAGLIDAITPAMVFDDMEDALRLIPRHQPTETG